MVLRHLIQYNQNRCTDHALPAYYSREKRVKDLLAIIPRTTGETWGSPYRQRLSFQAMHAQGDFSA
jgi:hypothetical protein